MVEISTGLEEAEERGEAAEPERDAGEPARNRRRAWNAAAMALVAAAFFALCLAVSLVGPWDADTSAVSLQGWDLVHGHLLLHGWWASDVNFATFDAPLYGLTMTVLGISGLSLHVAGALIYTIVFLASCWLVRGDATGSRYWLRVAMVALFASSVLVFGALRGTVLLVPDHLGTMVFLLVPFTLYDRYPTRRWTPWVLFAVLTLGQMGDATVRYIGVTSLVLVWVLELPRVRKLRTPTMWLAVAAVASVAASMAIRHLERSMGGYYLTPAKTSIAPLSDWGWHLTSTVESLMSIFAVPVDGFPGQGTQRIAMTFCGGLALAVGLLAVGTVLVRWTKAEPADRLLTVTILIYLGAYCFSTVTIPGPGGGYEFIGVVFLMACLVARNFSAPRLPGLRRTLTERTRSRAVIASTVAAALAATAFLLSGTELTQQRMQDPVETVALWLQDHGYTYGLADYWESTPVTIYSHGKVNVRAISPGPDGFWPRIWGTKAQWYEPQNAYADFVVTGGARNVLTTDAAEKSFGPPTQTYQLPGNYTVLVYSYNLLTKRLPVYPGSGA